MGILDELIEKKDLIAYIDSRRANLEYHKASIKKYPEKERGFIQRKLGGKIYELRKLKSLISQCKLKKASKKEFNCVAFRKRRSKEVEYKERPFGFNPPSWGKSGGES